MPLWRRKQFPVVDGRPRKVEALFKLIGDTLVLRGPELSPQQVE